MVKRIYIILEHHTEVLKNCRGQELRYHKKVHTFRDITDGSLYKENLSKLYSTNVLPETFHCMLMVNTDGAPVFKSHNYSIWPLYASMLELPPNKRRVFIMHE